MSKNKLQWIIALCVTIFNILFHVHTIWAVNKQVQSLNPAVAKREAAGSDASSSAECGLPRSMNSFHVPSPFNMEQPKSGMKTEELPICERASENNRVFLLETNRDYVIPKVLCTLESLARHMPNWCIALYVIDYDKSKVTKQELHLLSTYSNIRIANIDPNKAVLGTPFEGIFETRRFLKSAEKNLKAIHYSDILRAALLYMHGGIYLDLDLIAMKSVDLAPQYLVRTGKIALRMF